MLGINFKKMITLVMVVFALSALMYAVSSILCANLAFAAAADKTSGIFSALQKAGSEIFVGLREIIFVVSGFGIIAVAIGGFFGNLNWKWLAAIGIGLFVISTTSAVISYMVGEPPGNFSDVQGRVANGD